MQGSAEASLYSTMADECSAMFDQIEQTMRWGGFHR